MTRSPEKDGPGSRVWPFLGDAEPRLESGSPDAFQEMLERASDREELLLQALRIAGVGGWELDIATGRLSWSEETYRIFGVSPDVPISADLFYELVHPDDRKPLLSSQNQSTDTSAFFDAEYRIVRPDGALRYLRSRAQVVPRGRRKTNRFLGIVQDVTERRLFEMALEQERSTAQKLQADLIHISRVSAMGAMASALAHELNQPLTAITSYSSGVQKLAGANEECGEELVSALKAIHSNARRAAEIIRRVRAMTTRGEVKTTRVPVPECLREAIDLAVIGQDVAVTYDLEPRLYVDADRIQLQQVIINLIRNAVEAMEDSPEKRVEVIGRRSGDVVSLSIRDFGMGIDPDHLPTVFDSFMSTKPKGMGVGLAISRTIIESHGGRLTVQSRPGEGATFTLTLPRWGG